MIGRRGALTSCACFVVLSLPGTTSFRPSVRGTPEIVYDCDLKRYTAPPGYTVTDVKAVVDLLARGDPLPPGWALADIVSDVEAVLTGVADPHTGERQLVVTVTNESVDLRGARLVVDGRVEAVANRSNGGVVDRGTLGIASLSTFVRPVAPLVVSVEWEGEAGNVTKRTVSY